MSSIGQIRNIRMLGKLTDLNSWPSDLIVLYCCCVWSLFIAHCSLISLHTYVPVLHLSVYCVLIAPLISQVRIHINRIKYFCFCCCDWKSCHGPIKFCFFLSDVLLVRCFKMIIDMIWMWSLTKGSNCDINWIMNRRTIIIFIISWLKFLWISY